ncbi:hypothetical protein ECDEC8C_4134 [Escherichia coli DEC8C]|nr:hypothetical protein ECDEC8C_4134 [Escherichia coli DEC8C]
MIMFSVWDLRVLAADVMHCIHHPIPTSIPVTMIESDV